MDAGALTRDVPGLGALLRGCGRPSRSLLRRLFGRAALLAGLDGAGHAQCVRREWRDPAGHRRFGGPSARDRDRRRPDPLPDGKRRLGCRSDRGLLHRPYEHESHRGDANSRREREQRRDGGRAGSRRGSDAGDVGRPRDAVGPRDLARSSERGRRRGGATRWHRLERDRGRHIGGPGLPGHGRHHAGPRDGDRWGRQRDRRHRARCQPRRPVRCGVRHVAGGSTSQPGSLAQRRHGGVHAADQRTVRPSRRRADRDRGRRPRGRREVGVRGRAGCSQVCRDSRGRQHPANHRGLLRERESGGRGRAALVQRVRPRAGVGREPRVSVRIPSGHTASGFRTVRHPADDRSPYLSACARRHGNPRLQGGRQGRH